MATRRKYKVQHFRDGGRVLEDVPIEGDEPAEAGGFPSGILGDQPTVGDHDRLTPPSENKGDAPPIYSEPPADDNPLMRAFTAQQRAEELQREAAQRPPPSATVEQRIEKIPGLSEHKKNLLRQFPVIVDDPVVGQMFNRHYQAGLQSGLGDDTPELDNYLIANVAREVEQRRQLALAHESVDEAVQKLDDESAAIDRSEQPRAPVAPPPKPAAPRRSVPMSAPVSREVPMASGDRRQENTLRADEREIARVSFPHLPSAQAEYEYLKNKRRMLAMKADGSIQGDR